MQNLIIGSGRRRTSLIKLFSFPFPRFPLFIFALSPSGLARSWNQLLAVELDLWNSIFSPPQNPACLSSCSASLPCSPGIFSSEMSQLSQNLERVVNIPHNRQLLPNKNHPGIFFIPLGMPFMLFLTPPELWIPRNTQIPGSFLANQMSP